MGLYEISCSGCKKPFLWFSGNHLDQRCKECRDADPVIELEKIVDNAKVSEFTTVKMSFKVVGGSCDPEAKLKCPQCSEEFWVDPCGEDNLYWNGEELKAQCPKCGLKET